MIEENKIPYSAQCLSAADAYLKWKETQWKDQDDLVEAVLSAFDRLPSNRPLPVRAGITFARYEIQGK